MVQQINIYQKKPEINQQLATIIAIENSPKGTLIAVDKNIIRAAGGGEPSDIGTIRKDPPDSPVSVVDTEKRGGLTWYCMSNEAQSWKLGHTVTVQIDSGHRLRRRKLHTGTHMIIRLIKNSFDYEKVHSAEINQSASESTITFTPSRKIGNGDIVELDRAMRSLVHEQRSVSITKSKSLEIAKTTFGELLRASNPAGLRGKVRLVCIDGFDVNPCSGLHFDNTKIGPYAIKADHCSRGVCHLTLQLLNNWQYWFGDI